MGDWATCPLKLARVHQFGSVYLPISRGQWYRLVVNTDFQRVLLYLVASLFQFIIIYLCRFCCDLCLISWRTPCLSWWRTLQLRTKRRDFARVTYRSPLWGVPARRRPAVVRHLAGPRRRRFALRITSVRRVYVAGPTATHDQPPLKAADLTRLVMTLTDDTQPICYNNNQQSVELLL